MEKSGAPKYLRRGEIAYFMREGILIAGDSVEESNSRWLSKRSDSEKYECCAIGLVLIGVSRSVQLASTMFEERLRRPRDFRSCFAAMLELTSIEPKLFSQIHNAHHSLKRPAAAIADDLERTAA